MNHAVTLAGASFGILPALPIVLVRYDPLVQSIARLDTATAVDEILDFTLTEWAR